MSINVLAIAPYIGLRDLLLEMAQEEAAIHMDVEVADLEEALPLVYLAEERGYNMIVSRGGTANLIRKHCSLPVVDIPVSGYDILRVLTLVRSANSKVAIIGFPNICRAVSEVSSLLDFEIPTYAINDCSEVAEVLHRAFQTEVKIVLGDAVTVRAAQEMGYNGILITSGRESVGDMFREVKRMHEVYRQGQEKSEFYVALLDCDGRAVIALDANKTIVFINKAAAAIIGGNAKEHVRKTGIQHHLPDMNRLIMQLEEPTGPQERLQQFVYVNDRQYKVSVTKHVHTAHFQYLISLDSVDNWRNELKLAAYIPSRLKTFNQLIGSSVALKKTISRAHKLAQSDRGIWISGEKGTGKTSFAQAIHSASKRRDQGFYMIPCEEMTEQELESLLSSKLGLSLPETGFAGTIYLNHADRLDTAAQARWLQVIKRYPGIRFFASSSVTLSRLKSRPDFNQDLLAELSELHITIPPLRERLEDLDELISVFTASYNSESGKQIVGLRESAFDELVSHSWEGNLRELENALHEMLILTQGNYVDAKDAASVIDRYRQSAALGAKSAYAAIDIGGTMEEIERRIIMHVLQEEGMNQSRTCRRLDINRTTLWRKTSKSFNKET